MRMNSNIVYRRLLKENEAAGEYEVASYKGIALKSLFYLLMTVVGAIGSLAIGMKSHSHWRRFIPLKGSVQDALVPSIGVSYLSFDTVTLDGPLEMHFGYAYQYLHIWIRLVIFYLSINHSQRKERHRTTLASCEQSFNNSSTT